MEPARVEPTEVCDALKLKVLHWAKEWKIPGTPWTIRGFSRSAYRTGFYIPELDMMLDAGPQCFNKPSFILISHTHIDHIACLPLTMIGDIHGTHVFQIYGPTPAKGYVERYIQSMFEVNSLEKLDAVPSWFTYNGVGKGDKFRITSNRTELDIETFDCDHPVATVSYGVSELKQKLKEEYAGKPGKDIAALRKQGFQVTEVVMKRAFAYVCDTSIAVFDMNPGILAYPVVWIECTFFMDDELENAIATKHVHWAQLKPIVLANPKTLFVLFHFSQRYRDVEVAAFFQKEKIENIYWW